MFIKIEFKLKSLSVSIYTNPNQPEVCFIINNKYQDFCRFNLSKKFSSKNVIETYDFSITYSEDKVAMEW